MDRRFIGMLTLMLAVSGPINSPAQVPERQSSTDDIRTQIEKRQAIESELESLAIVERKVMIPMRDGKRMAADVYIPKDPSKKYPIIFVRTPYNFNYWDVQLGAPQDMSEELEAIKRGYAFVEINERGKYFSEGEWDYLGAPLSDGDDELNWMSNQPWTNGKVGTIGCSSNAEWQLGVASLGNNALAAIIPEGFGAGIGRVRPYFEQGNWYRGGALQMILVSWLYSQQNIVRPLFPPDTSQDDLIRASKFFDLDPHLPPVNWTAFFSHLPEQDMFRSFGDTPGIFADVRPVPGGGALIRRTPNDPAWYKGALWHDNMPINVPGLWLMSWYDVSIGPNLAAYNYVRSTTHGEIANEQYAVIAPTGHCAFTSATEHTIVGERDLGDARLDYDELTYGWFDHFLKEDDNHVLQAMPRVLYYTMGSNKWQKSNTWPPEGSKNEVWFFASDGHANTRFGDGVLSQGRPEEDHPDKFAYDPMHPVPSRGGAACCEPAWVSGSVDQRKIEERPDVLVYSSAPLNEGLEVSGPIIVAVYISSDVKDTDITAKILDVYPDGTAYNLDQTIQRVRWRNGYERPPEMMKRGQVYKVILSPMNTSNYFARDHRIRLEISGSSFPQFDRNLNTGGSNYDETVGITAHTSIHHSREYPSSVELSIVPIK
jgi:putative CocE/NonD family hydrolase